MKLKMMGLNSIVTKLWLSITLLVLVVLGFSVLIQSSLLKHTYYQQQTDQLINAAKNLAEDIAKEEKTDLIRYKIEDTASAAGVHVMLLDRQGRLLYSQGGSVRRGWHGHMMGNNHSAAPWSQNWPLVSLKKVLDGETVTQIGRSPWFETETLTVGVPVIKENKVSGVLLLHASIPVITTRLRALQYVAVYTGIGGIMLATLLSLFLSRTLVRPLLKINNAAQDMAQGNYSKKLHIKSNDEIGMLANSFNRLSAELKEKIETLEKLDQARRDFVASVSHELRTPLTIIQAYTEALQDGLAKNNNEKQKYLSYIHAELLRLRRLVDDLLDLRRLETGQVKLNYVPVNIKLLIQRAVNGINSIAREKGAAVETQLPVKLPNVIGDEDRLAQVIINLLDNALRVSGEGDKISVLAEEKDNFVAVSICDTGPGIPEDDIPLIWEKFYKVDKSRARVGAGTGLGLAISKKIIDMHGGTISVNSTVGKGSKFTFTVPKEN
ncbi:MAG: HAMP domain-containing protein [Desulfotomaculum sp.]|nr:HAMP domain-containing protein [Desulfotomaculum sp.]